MKKLALTLAILATFTFGGVAQSLNYDFEDGTLQGWTTLDGDGDGHCWELSIGGMGHNSNGMVMAYSKDYATGEPLTPNEYLVSPRLVLSEDWPVIRFYACALDEIYPAEHFGVSISTTVNNDPLAFTLLSEWTIAAKDAGNRQGNWYNYTVDLSAYTGQEVYVAIRHHYCSGQSAICIDDIEIEGTIQDYFPMVHEANNRQKWNVVYMGSMNYPNDYHTEIQSIRDNINLDGVDYKLVWKESVYQSKKIAGAVREEDKRVYFRRYWGQSYEDEVLLYDFNLTVGDTVTVGWGDYQLIVLEESETEVNGTMRRQLGLAWYFGEAKEVQEYWIEGVGSTYGFLNSGYEGWTGAFVHLLCYHENGNLIWDNEEFDDCVMNSDGTLASFAPQGAEWYFHVLSQGPITEPPFYYIRHAVTGEAEVQGHLCSVIDGYRYVYEEDGVVYMYNHSTDAFTVMYDFNAEEGDTWYCDIEEGFTCLVTVESVDSVTWNGHTYRAQYVTGYIPDEGFLIYDGRIIEGIGYEKGLFPHEFVYDGTEYAYIRCYLEDGELLYHEGNYDCDYVPGNQPQQPQFEWYYEIQNEDGSITYQYMYQAGDTIINDEPTHILVKINTLYDKGLREEVTHEYVFELNGKLYWWNKRLGLFTVLYDYEAEVGDSWNIFVGTEILTMHVDGVDYIEYEGVSYRVLHVSDPDDLFSGDIVCGIGHLTSFFPEKLMDNRDGVRVEGMRCYWSEGELVFKYGDEDCDAVYSEVHGVEEDGPSTGSGTFTVYPNPTNGILTVHHSAFRIHHSEFQIANLMGQTVLSGNINAENQQIDVSSLPQGMYFITVGEATRKFVVR